LPERPRPSLDWPASDRLARPWVTRLDRLKKLDSGAAGSFAATPPPPPRNLPAIDLEAASRQWLCWGTGRSASPRRVIASRHGPVWQRCLTAEFADPRVLMAGLYSGPGDPGRRCVPPEDCGPRRWPARRCCRREFGSSCVATHDTAQTRGNAPPYAGFTECKAAPDCRLTPVLESVGGLIAAAKAGTASPPRPPYTWTPAQLPDRRAEFGAGLAVLLLPDAPGLSNARDPFAPRFRDRQLGTGKA
jgi:hypothetical protein